MKTVDNSDLINSLEEGFGIVDLMPLTQSCFLRVGLLFRKASDPATGHFVLIRKTTEASVWLGAVVDARNRIQEWVEIWVQEVVGTLGFRLSYRESVTNGSLDAGWEELAEYFEEADPGSYIACPWESVNPKPLMIHPGTLATEHPIDDGSGKSWELCRNESLLKQAGLAPYASSATRYLYIPELGADGPFIWIDGAEPPPAKAGRVSDLTGNSGGSRVPFNLHCGRLFLRRFAPVALDEYTDLLSGRPWAGLGNSRKGFRLSGVYKTLEDENSIRCGAAHLFSGLSGIHGRQAEVLYLKLQLIQQIALQIKTQIERY